MTKPVKFKGKQGRFDIEFVGIDLVFRNVLVTEVDRGKGQDWALLQRRGKTTTILTTPGYLVEPVADEVQELRFDRSIPEQPKLTNAYGETHTITKHTRLKLSAELYSLDQYPDGMRIQYTDNLIGASEHKLIECIRFTKVG